MGGSQNRGGAAGAVPGSEGNLRDRNRSKGRLRSIGKTGKEREIKVIGNDFLDENKKWVERGAINFLIGQDSYMQGYEPVMMLFHLLFDDEKPESVYRYAEIVIKNRYNL